MIKLYFAPRTRSVRILWLLEELGLPYELERVGVHSAGQNLLPAANPHRKAPYHRRRRPGDV